MDDFTAGLVQPPERLERLEELAFRLLETTGIEAPEEELLAEMAAAGFEVDRSESRIRFPRNLSEGFLDTVPRGIVLGSRDPADDLVLDPDAFFVRPQSGCPNVLDPRTGAFRPALLRDVEQMAVLNDALPNIQLAASLLYPSDVPARSRDLATLAALFGHTRKHVYIQPYDPVSMARMLEMAVCLRRGADEVRKRPPFTAIMGLTSPLVFAPNEIGVMRLAARSGIPLMCGSTPMSGATGPMTLAGEIVLQHAENLAGLIIAQVMRSGAPVSCGIRPSTMDIRTGASVWGSVEWGMMTGILLQLTARRGLISDTVGLSTDSKTADIQAGAEKGMSCIFSALFEANVAAGAGFLDTIMTGSFEQLVVDDDLAGAMERVRRGVSFGEEDLAVDLMEKIGPGGNYLAEPHTVEHMRDEVFIPAVFNREIRHRWEQSGSAGCAETARARARELIGSHAVPPLPDGVSAELARLARLDEPA